MADYYLHLKISAMGALNTYCKMLLENTQYLPTCSLKKKVWGVQILVRHPHSVFQSVVSYCSCECIDSSLAFFLSKSNLDPSAFFSVLLKSLILIHELHYQSRSKGSPTPAATSSSAECAKGRSGRPPGGAARGRGARSRPPGLSPRRHAPEWPAPPPDPARQLQRPGGKRDYGETWLPRRQCRAGTQRRSSGSRPGRKV